MNAILSLCGHIVETAPLYCAMARRPAPTEYAGWFDRYIRLVEDVDDLAETMARQLDETMA